MYKRQDRINSNFSKISIEVEEIKQNGGGGSGGGGDVTNAEHATSAYTLDKDTPVQNWFLSALHDDDAQGIINFLKGLKIAGNLDVYKRQVSDKYFPCQTTFCCNFSAITVKYLWLL